MTQILRPSGLSMDKAGGEHVSNGAGTEHRQLGHDPGLSLDWSAEEQSILEDGLSKCVSPRLPAEILCCGGHGLFDIDFMFLLLLGVADTPPKQAWCDI